MAAHERPELLAAVIGVPFSAQGFVFFIAAIVVGIYQYGWNRLTPVAHWPS